MTRIEQNKKSKEKILQTALQEFAAFGYRKASTNRICKKSGISKGLLFYYFHNKEQLYLVCVQKCFEASTDCLENQCRIGSSVEESIKNYFALRRDFFQKHPYYKNIYCYTIFFDNSYFSDKLYPILLAWRECVKGFLEKMLANVVLRNTISKDTVVQFILEQNDFICSDISRALKNKQEEINKIYSQQESRLIFLTDILSYGILCEKERKTPFSIA